MLSDEPESMKSLVNPGFRLAHEVRMVFRDLEVEDGLGPSRRAAHPADLEPSVTRGEDGIGLAQLASLHSSPVNDPEMWRDCRRTTGKLAC